jgi:hypothetical protein
MVRKFAIDANGMLSIFRTRRMKGSVGKVVVPQNCPYGSGQARCGDWCPHFNINGEPGSVVLSTCIRTYTAGQVEVIDERFTVECAAAIVSEVVEPIEPIKE